MLYLGWLGACSHMLDLYKVAISLYDHLVFDFWCHLMLLLMLLCHFAWLWPLLLSYLVAPSLLLALILYWVWALLVHPTPKNQVFQCVHHTYLLAICYSKVHLTCFYLSFKLNSFGVMRKLVSKALTNLMAHFIFLILKNLTLWLSYVDLLCLQVVNWKLAQPCRHGASFQYCTSYLSWYHDLLFMDTRDVK
jgi:hypothetical protein